MLILAVDTTSERGSLALLSGSELLEEVDLLSADGYSSILFSQIEALLTRHKIALKSIDAFASASGPGSFSGVRMGLTAIKGLAEALNRPAFGISNLQALATLGTRPLRAPVLDARRGDIYGAVYDADSRIVQAEGVTKLGHWISNLPEGDLEIVSNGVVLPDGGRRVTHVSASLAASIGRIALKLLMTGVRPVPEEIDANYVRRSDAELSWRDTA